MNSILTEPVLGMFRHTFTPRVRMLLVEPFSMDVSFIMEAWSRVGSHFVNGLGGMTIWKMSCSTGMRVSSIPVPVWVRIVLIT